MMDKPTEAGVVGMQALSHIPTTETYADNVVSVSMAILLVQDGKRDAANRLLSSVRQRQGDTAFMRMFIESAESEQDLQDGLLQQAKARLRIAVGATHSTSSAFDTTNGNAWAGVLYAFACYEAGQLDEAKKLLRVYSPVVQTMGSHDHLILALICLSRIARAQGDTDESIEYLAELEHAGMARNLPRLTASAWLERSREHVLAGHAQSATEAILRADIDDVWATNHQLRRLPHSALDPKICNLRWGLHFGDSRRSLSDIDAELAVSRSKRWQLRTLTLELMRAAALSKNGHESTALEQLAHTLRFTAEQEMVRLVVDEGPLVTALIGKMLLREKNRSSDPKFIAYLQKLSTNFVVSPSLDDAKNPQLTQGALLSPLTLKEQEVLSLLAEGYSNQALSDELGVSESTVRTHLRNINSKLDVTSRMQAVAKARQIGLLK
jgi:LuxR family maltose regulon positive regulatory protein